MNLYLLRQSLFQCSMFSEQLSSHFCPTSRGRVVGQTNQTDNRDRRTDRGSGRLTPEDSGHPLTTGANTKQCDAQPVSSLSGVTPTKDQVIHKVTEWVTADRSLVTHEEDLRLMADVYSRCLAGG